MMNSNINFAVIVPLANESKGFKAFVLRIQELLDFLDCGKVYLVIDNASKDNTRQLCEKLEETDLRFVAVWAPENKNVVDAYLKGYQYAYEAGHEIIIEMDGGLSHDPRAIPMFLRVLTEGNDCAFGSRFINGGSIQDSNYFRHFLSRGGTLLSNFLLGTRLKDMTSGYQGFHRSIVRCICEYGLLSKGHFYQTEVRYLLKKSRYAEVPIHYRAPSNSVSKSSVKNSIYLLLLYTWRRFAKKSDYFIEESTMKIRNYKKGSN